MGFAVAMVTQTLSLFVCVRVCDCQRIRRMNLADILLFTSTLLSAPLLRVCRSVRASACVRTGTLSVCVSFLTHVRVCGCVSPRVCNIMIVHTHEYICGFKSNCLPRRVQTAALMRRASVVRTVVLRARRQIMDLLYSYAAPSR